MYYEISRRIFVNRYADMTLDRTDSEIVALLQKNGRLSNKEIAAAVGLAPSSSWERVKRLVADRVFTGFHAQVDPGSLGIRLQAMMAIRLGRHSHDAVERFRREVLEIPEVIAVYHLAGRDDFLLHVAVRDGEHLRQLLLSQFTTREEVAHIETNLVFEYVRKEVWPNYAGSGEP
jgi:DNA-binding Lrp family transcriptional regulator